MKNLQPSHRYLLADEFIESFCLQEPVKSLCIRILVRFLVWYECNLHQNDPFSAYKEHLQRKGSSYFHLIVVKEFLAWYSIS
jgi:hypothetical protein